MVIDFHTHCFPDDIAVKAIPALASCAKIPARVNGTIGGLKESMKLNGIAYSVVLSIATKPSQTEKINNWSAEIQKDNILAFGSIHPRYENWKNELIRIKELGLKGIKFHPDYQEFFVDDPGMYPIYEFAFKLGLIVVFHAGVDIGLLPPYHCTPDRLRKIVDLFPGGNIIAAHMGGFDYWHEVEKHLVGKEVYLDTSYCLGPMGGELAKKIIINHGFNKILFATDSPWCAQGEEMKRLRELKLDKAAEDAIFYRNALNLMQIK